MRPELLHPPRRRQLPCSEDGASLIMVIIFVMVFAIIGAAILDFASTGFKTSESIVEIRDEQHAVDGAMEAAINAVRGNNTAGYFGQPCPDFTYTPPSGTDDPTVVVSCSPITGAGGIDDDQPKYAVLTLGTTTNDGLRHIGTRGLVIDGGMFSNSVVTVNTASNASISVFGNALAVKECTPESSPGIPEKMTATGDLQCRLESSSHALKNGEPDPDYPAAMSAITAPIDPAAVCTSGGVVKFFPGVYTEHPKNHIPAACASSRVWWFSPSSPVGAYYFDIANDPSTGADESLWNLQALGVSVVGGDRLGWSDSSTDAQVNALMPPEGSGACSTTASGVQFIFGGTTRMFVQRVSNAGSTVGRLNLCSSASSLTSQQIALYGLKSGSTPSGTSSGLVQKPPPAPAPSGPLVPAAATRTPDGAPGSTTIIGATGSSPSEIVEQVYSDFEDIPEGSVVSKAYLDVYHAEGSTKVVPSVKLTVGAFEKSYPLTNRTSFGTAETVDITNDLKTVFRYRDVNSAVATFRADGSSLDGPVVCPIPPKGCKDVAGETASVSLDAVVLRVEYRPPAMRQHACPSAGECPIFDAGDNAQSVVNGTVYAPSAMIELRVHNVGEFVLKRGVIARKIIADANSSMTQTESPFSLPGLTNVRRVLFTAKIGSTSKLRAVVWFTDTKGGNALPGYIADVKSWVVLR